MRFVEPRAALALCVALALPLPVAGTVSFSTNEEEDIVDAPSPGNLQAITLADVNGAEPDLAVLSPTLIYLLQGNGVVGEGRF